MSESKQEEHETSEPGGAGLSGSLKLLVALVVAFLYYAGQITAFSSESNRFADVWGVRDTIAILLGICGLGLIAHGTDWLLRRLRARRLKRLFNHLFILALVGGFLATFPQLAVERPNVATLVWIVAATITGASWASGHDRVVRWAANVALILSPVLVIMPVQMFCWTSWRTTSALRHFTPAGDDAGTPVLLIICDQWSWQRSSDAGRFSSIFPNVNELCEQAVLFPNALSADETTIRSLPKILYQKTGEVVVRDGATYWGEGVDSPRTDEIPNLFTLSRENGYATSLIGFHLPFQRILGDSVDDFRFYRRRPLKDGWGGKIVVRFLDNVPYWSDPISRHLSQRVEDLVDSWHRTAVYREVLDSRDAFDEVVETSPRRGFLVFHFRPPHYPHVFLADGSFNDKLDEQALGERYRHQLEYTDVLLGQFVERLRRCGKFDDALVVLTSDHGLRSDPDKERYHGDADWLRRVPLVIKLPGQRSARVFDQPLANNQLRPLFEAVFRGERDTDRLLDLLGGLPNESDEP